MENYNGATVLFILPGCSSMERVMGLNKESSRWVLYDAYTPAPSFMSITICEHFMGIPNWWHCPTPN